MKQKNSSTKKMAYSSPLVKKIFPDGKNSFQKDTSSILFPFKQFTICTEKFYLLLAFLKR